jgi:hypothetical protein
MIYTKNAAEKGIHRQRIKRELERWVVFINLEISENHISSTEKQGATKSRPDCDHGIVVVIPFNSLYSC